MGAGAGEEPESGVDVLGGVRIRAAFSLGTWEPGSHEMFKLKRNFW